MDQLTSLVDSRLQVSGCIYCGGSEETREHVPPRVFLDEPYPENLPVLPACKTCNQGYSLDESYVAALLGVTASGSTDPQRIRRVKIAKLIAHSPALGRMLEDSRAEFGGKPAFMADSTRLRNVLSKIARGHAIYELTEFPVSDPDEVCFQSLSEMSATDREEFDSFQVVEIFNEIGSRSMQRYQVLSATLAGPEGVTKVVDLCINDWVTVQESVYRYLVIEEFGQRIQVRIIFEETFAASVTWYVKEIDSTEL